MFEFKKEQILNKPINEVFPFFETPENLEKITPKNLGFIIKTPRPLVMKKGAIFDYTIKLGLVKFPWKTLISVYDPPYIFQDVQQFGPYRKWEHTHEFIPMDDKTLVTDTVIYDLYPKFLNSFVNKLFIRKKIHEIFDYRENVLNEIFNKI